MRWASTIATTARLEDALDEGLDTLAAELEGARPDLLIVFAHPSYSDHLSRLAPGIAACYPDAVVVGCSASGVIGGGFEVEHQPGLSLMAAALPGVELTPFHLAAEPESWRDQIDVRAQQSPAFLLFPDPFTCPAEELVRWFDSVYPRCVKLGGLASGGSGPGTSTLFAGPHLARMGAVGVAMSGDIEVDTMVTQGCRPIGSPVFVTRADGNVILELDGQPAITTIEAMHAQLSTTDQELFTHALMLGLVTDGAKQVYGQGDFLIRNIVGVEPHLGALAVAAEVTENQVVQFHLRDAEASSADLEQMLTRYDGESPAGALLFSCLGRGTALYGHSNHDNDLFQHRFGDVPLGGFFGNGEIGPVGHNTFVHGYTSAFGLFRPRQRS